MSWDTTFDRVFQVDYDNGTSVEVIAVDGRAAVDRAGRQRNGGRLVAAFPVDDADHEARTYALDALGATTIPERPRYRQ